MHAGQTMDLINGLHTFIRVVETGSFSAVAREANASQSAVTRQVAQLEEHFGVRLFHRTTRKISLTDEGQDLVGRARHLLEEAEGSGGYIRQERRLSDRSGPHRRCRWARRCCWCPTS